MPACFRRRTQHVPGGVLTLIQVVIGAMIVLLAWLLRGVIDAAVAGNREGFWTYSLRIGELASQAVNRHLLESMRTTLENRFKERLFHTLLTKDYFSVVAIHSGEWINRLTPDAAIVANSLVSIIPGVAEMVVWLVRGDRASALPDAGIGVCRGTWRHRPHYPHLCILQAAQMPP